jgi:Restriction endonuclease
MTKRARLDEDNVAISAPTRTLNTLPYKSLEWRTFELFSAELISRLPEFDFVQNYGEAPDKQFGIDIVAQKGKKRWAFQCKRVELFRPGDFRKVASAATSFSADVFVLILSSRARRQLVDEVAGAGWKLWDSAQIDRKIRGLSTGFDLVEGYFGRDIARAFLGKRRPGVFLSPGEYFAPFLKTQRVGGVTTPLVGRREELNTLQSFFDDEEHRVLIIGGVGGIGKTKLLFESTNLLPRRNVAMCLVREAAKLDDEALDELPQNAKVVAIDDVQGVQNVDNLLSLAVRSGRIKLVITVPAGNENVLLRQLQSLGYEASEIVRLALRGLGRKHSEDLTQQILGAQPLPVLKMVHERSSGNPLVIQIIAFLLSEGRGSLIEGLAEAPDTVDLLLARYASILAGHVARDQDIGRQEVVLAMQLFAAVGPTDIRTEDFSDRATRFLDSNATQLARVTKALEAACILVRSGSKSRIVPDLLRLLILKDAAGAESIRPSFVEDAVAAFGYDRQLLVNLAAVDLMTRDDRRILEPVWRELEAFLKTAPPFDRISALDELGDLGRLMPREMLSVVELVMRNPSQADPDQSLAGLYEFTQSDVLRSLPRILGMIGTVGYTRRCVQLLWELGRDEQERIVVTDAFTTLVGMARYGRYKSTGLNLEVLNEIERINKRPEEQVYHHLPIEVAAPVLAKSFDSWEERGATAVFRRLPVAAKAVRDVRGKAIDILADALAGPSLRAAVKSLGYFVECLKQPGLLPPDPETEAIWIAEQDRVLDILTKTRHDDERWLLKASLVSALSWHAQANPRLVVRQRCSAIIAGLEESAEFDWYAALVPDIARSMPSILLGSDLDALQSAIDGLLDRVVGRVLRDSQSPKLLAELLRNSLEEIGAAGLRGSAGWFFLTLAAGNIDYAKRLAESVVADFPISLGNSIGSVITIAWASDPTWTERVISAILDSGEQKLLMSLAYGLWSLRQFTGRPNFDAAYRAVVLSRLMELGNSEVREIGFHAVTNLMKMDKKAAIAVIIDTQSGRDAKVADELFASLRDVEIAELDETAMTRLLSYMVDIDEIEYWGFEFLRRLSESHPSAVLRLLMRRIREADGESQPGRNYKPVPYGQAIVPNVVHFFEALALPEATLREALEDALTLGPMGRYWFAELVSNLALRPEGVFTALQALNLDENRDRLEFVADVIQRVPAQAMFENAVFVSQIADTAALFGQDCERRVHGALFACAIGGMRTGTPFQPMAQDLLMIESARSVRAKLVPGSPADRLFADVEQYGERSIRRQEEYDIDTFGEPE